MGARLDVTRLRHHRGHREVLRAESLAVEPGERVAVLGPNGAGKTTLLRLLAGVERPTAGAVLLDGRPAWALDVTQRRGIGYVTQQPGLLTTTVRRNVELPLSWRRVPRSERRRRVETALELLGIARLADRTATRLSGGEQQRVSLARSLTLDPLVLLLDEPAAGLDAPARSAFLSDLDDALTDRQTTTVVHVTHRPAEALRGADRVVVLVDGTVHQVGPPVEVVRRPADLTVATLVGYHNALSAQVGPDGAVVVDGDQDGTRLAVPASGLHIGPVVGGLLTATVVAVAPGPGRWEVHLDRPRLVAHRPIGERPPPVGAHVGVTVDPAVAARVPLG